jgi:hypothetical protein
MDHPGCPLQGFTDPAPNLWTSLHNTCAFDYPVSKTSKPLAGHKKKYPKGHRRPSPPPCMMLILANCCLLLPPIKFFLQPLKDHKETHYQVLDFKVHKGPDGRPTHQLWLPFSRGKTRAPDHTKDPTTGDGILNGFFPRSCSKLKSQVSRTGPGFQASQATLAGD